MFSESLTARLVVRAEPVMTSIQQLLSPLCRWKCCVKRQVFSWSSTRSSEVFVVLYFCIIQHSELTHWLVLNFRELNSTIGSVSGETWEAVRELYPPSPGVTVKTPSLKKLPREATTPAVDVNSIRWVLPWFLFVSIFHIILFYVFREFDSTIGSESGASHDLYTPVSAPQMKVLREASSLFVEFNSIQWGLCCFVSFYYPAFRIDSLTGFKFQRVE